MQSLGVRVLLFLSIFGSLNVSAQVTAGGLRGIVTDPNGATIADATLRATNAATGITSEATSTSAGVYVIGNLPVGQYRVEAQAQGFKTSVTEDVQISTGTISTLNISLQIGEIKQTVEVKETVTPLLQTTTSEVSTNVEQHVVMDLPLELSGDRRQVANAAQLRTTREIPPRNSRIQSSARYHTGRDPPGKTEASGGVELFPPASCTTIC